MTPLAARENDSYCWPRSRLFSALASTRWLFGARVLWMHSLKIVWANEIYQRKYFFMRWWYYILLLWIMVGLQWNPKWLIFCRQHFEMCFAERKSSILIGIQSKVLSNGHINQHWFADSLANEKLQAVTWTTDDPALGRSICGTGLCIATATSALSQDHDDVIKWKYFSRYWPFVRGIHRWPVNSPHKGQWRGALMLSLVCACIRG